MRSLKDIRESKVPGTPKKMNMKKLFRRNQIIITTLAVMIAAAGYLNYAGKQEMASGTDVYEAGVTDISDEDILAENQALTGDPGNYQEIASLDNDPVMKAWPLRIQTAPAARRPAIRKAWREMQPRTRPMQPTIRRQKADSWQRMTQRPVTRKPVWKIRGKQS